MKPQVSEDGYDQDYEEIFGNLNPLLQKGEQKSTSSLLLGPCMTEQSRKSLFSNKENHTPQGSTKTLLTNSWLAHGNKNLEWFADDVQDQYNQGKQVHVIPTKPYSFGK